MIFSNKESDYLDRASVARLGTIDSEGKVQIVPIVFARYGNKIFFVIDRKKKTTTTTKSAVESPRNLKRLRNISRNPNATLLVDQYSDEWRDLSFLMIYCRAQILWPGEKIEEKRKAAALLKRKYAQYRSGEYFPASIDSAIFVKLTPERCVFWQNLHTRLA